MRMHPNVVPIKIFECTPTESPSKINATQYFSYFGTAIPCTPDQFLKNTPKCPAPIKAD